MAALPDINTILSKLEKISPREEQAQHYGGQEIHYFVNEFWTSRQRQSSSIHEISYRACFKPQLPRFFIELLSGAGDLIYDPFAGRGTTIIEAALMGRRIIANDINPLSKILSEPRLRIPSLQDVSLRLKNISNKNNITNDFDLSMFYHPKTEEEILSLRYYLHEKNKLDKEDEIDRWIRMVATNRLTGHSKGFFSVYTMPPNQAVSIAQQKKINLRLNQIPEYRNVNEIILKKTIQLLRTLKEEDIAALRKASRSALFLEEDASKTDDIVSASVNLTVTSPPFLNIVQYSKDNWLRCWFNHIDPAALVQNMTMAATLDEWSKKMESVFEELFRITKDQGWVAFEVGEVRGGKIKLEETIIPLGINRGFTCAGVIINRQQFTKTSNIWGIKNNRAGTNSNRIVLFQKK
ncbi:MAG: DNA methyltransferase [Bacillota bacterium]|nr:DNA methyltransferase [Bacillota bacterium]